MKERDIRVVFSMITGLLAEIAALFSGYSRGSLLIERIRRIDDCLRLVMNASGAKRLRFFANAFEMRCFCEHFAASVAKRGNIWYTVNRKICTFVQKEHPWKPQTRSGHTVRS